MADNDNKTQEELKREMEEDMRNNPDGSQIDSQQNDDMKAELLTPTDEEVKEIDKSMAEESGLLESLSKAGVSYIDPSVSFEYDEETEQMKKVKTGKTIDDVISEEEKRNFELNLDYVEGLYKTMLINRMLDERKRIIEQKLKEEKERLKNEDLSYFERKKKEKSFETDLYADYYSVEKELAEKRRKAIERHEELQKTINKTGNKHQGAIQEQIDLEKEFMLGDSLDDYIQAAYMSNETQNKLKEKYPDVAQKLDSDVMSISDQQKYENKNLRRADGITKQFNQDFPEVKKEVNGFMSKLKNFAAKNQKAIKTAGYILTGVGLVTNLPATAAVLGFNAIMKTKTMKNLKEKISNDIGNGLDKLGYTEDSKLRKGLKVAGIVAGIGVTVGVGMLAAGNVDMGDITKQVADLKVAGAEALNEGIKQAGEAANVLNEKLEGVKSSVMDNVDTGTFDPDTFIPETPQFENITFTADTTMEDIVKNLGSDLGLSGKELETVVEFMATEYGVNPNNIPAGTQLNLPMDQEQFKNYIFQQENQEKMMEIMMGESPKPAPADATPAIPPLEVSSMVDVTVQKGDTLTGLLERVDGVEFDLVGGDLTAVAQLVAEQNGIPNADIINPGQVINMPSNPEALKQFVEANQERLQEIIKEQAAQATQQVVEQSANIGLSADFLSSNSEAITDSLFEQTMSDREWSRLESKLGVDREELEKLVQENITKQIENGTFPTKIEMELNSYNGRHQEVIEFTTHKMEQTANLIAQQNGVENTSNVAINYDDSKIESSQAVEKPENGKPKKGMKLS